MTKKQKLLRMKDAEGNMHYFDRNLNKFYKVNMFQKLVNWRYSKRTMKEPKKLSIKEESNSVPQKVVQKKKGIIITDAKVVGLCSKCRKEGDEVIKNIYDEITPDKDISCLNDAFGQCKSNCPKQEKTTQDSTLQRESNCPKEKAYSISKDACLEKGEPK